MRRMLPRNRYYCASRLVLQHIPTTSLLVPSQPTPCTPTINPPFCAPQSQARVPASMANYKTPQLTLGTAREQFEHLMNRTCPRPLLFRPFPLLFLVMMAAVCQQGLVAIFQLAKAVWRRDKRSDWLSGGVCGSKRSLPVRMRV